MILETDYVLNALLNITYLLGIVTLALKNVMSASGKKIVLNAKTAYIFLLGVAVPVLRIA